MSDHLGSTRAVVDDGGTVLETFDYYPFGLLMPKRNTANANTLEKFTGKERDDEGGLNLDYFWARYYDAAIGRWSAVDPYAEKYPGWSPYNYTLDNPVNALDPDRRVVVFINGRHDLSGHPDRKAMEQLWGNTDDRLRNFYFKGENAVYRDGSSAFLSLFPGQRQAAGHRQSGADYNQILSHVKDERKRGLSGTVKLFTHSMGAAYGRGYAMELLQAHAESKSSEELTIEFIVDITPFQEADLPNIDDVDLFHASDGDPLSDGVDPSGSQKLGVTSISSEDYMHMSHHALQSYDIDRIMEEINSFLSEN